MLLVTAWTRTEGAIITASSVSRDDVAAAVSSAVDGDTVIIPSGTATWTNGLSIVEKAITIKGAGSDQTIIIDEIVNRSQVMWINFTKLTGMFRLTGIQIKGGTANTGNNTTGIVKVLGSNLEFGNSKWRIDHCSFNRQFGRPIYVYAWTGLIDNCTFNQNGAPGMAFDGRIPDSNNKGHRSWATPVRWGTVDSGVYVEKCSMTNNVGRAITDGFAGARFVFRYNTCTNLSAENHGTESTGIYRGTRSMEVYNNTFTATASGEYAVLFRSGTGVVFNNAVTGAFPGLMRMVNYRNRDSYAPWGQASGRNQLDVNSPTLFDSGSCSSGSGSTVLTTTKNWTANQWVGYHLINTTTSKAGEILSNTDNTITCYGPVFPANQILWNTSNTFEIRRIDKALDQPGAGMGDLMTGGTNTPAVAPTPAVWPNQADEPIYYWNNTGITNVSNAGYYTIRAGRDYKNVSKPGYTPLVFPHPYAGAIISPPANLSASPGP